MSKDALFKNRVSESDIARILKLIHDLPGKHEDRRVKDQVGSYDFWFEGGACKINTGSMEFNFDDGTKAFVGAPIPWVSILIEFPNGEKVKVEQEVKK